MIEGPPGPGQKDAPDAGQAVRARTRLLLRHARTPRIRPAQVLVAWLGAFAGIAALALLVDLFPKLQLLVIGSFGASAVLLFAAPGAPFSQPRNLVGGHVISAIVGVACYRYLPDLLFVQEGAAVATAIALMMATRTIHPPGGATALIAVIGPDAVRGLGWAYVLPVLAGAVLLMLVAIVSNNLFVRGSYPDRWG
ncbi:MAG: HPP family protein [Gammaproteobacteria bacterium]|nr:HPP family protein [Gammaproteobacteria bacterium]